MNDDRWILKSTHTYMPLTEHEFVCGLSTDEYNAIVTEYRNAGKSPAKVFNSPMVPRSMGFIVSYLSGGKRGFYDADFPEDRNVNATGLVVVNVVTGVRIPASGLEVIVQ